MVVRPFGRSRFALALAACVWSVTGRESGFGDASACGWALRRHLVLLGLVRGCTAWTMGECRVALLELDPVFLAPLPYKWRSLPESMGLLTFLFVMLALAGVPSVCFHLRSSRLWFKERRGNRGPGYVGGCLTAGFILLLAAGAFLPAFHSGRHVVLVNKGQEVSRLLRENELAKSYGGAWVDPNACSNSVEFLRKVQKAIRGDETGLPSVPEWTVMVNPPEGVDGFPLLFTANVDVTVFPEVWDGNAGGDARLVLRPGILVDSDKIALVVRSSGCAQILNGKYARRKSLLGPSPWKLTQQTYFLTPTGKVRLDNQ